MNGVKKMMLSETKLRALIRRLLFEEVLGEPDQSREDERDKEDQEKDPPEDPPKTKSGKDVLQEPGATDEFNTVASVAPGGMGPATPLGTGPDGGKSGPSKHLRKRKKNKK